MKAKKRKKIKVAKVERSVRSKVIHVRLNNDEYHAVSDLARHANLSLSQFIRAIIFQ